MEGLLSDPGLTSARAQWSAPPAERKRRVKPGAPTRVTNVVQYNERFATGVLDVSRRRMVRRGRETSAWTVFKVKVAPSSG